MSRSPATALRAPLRALKRSGRGRAPRGRAAARPGRASARAGRASTRSQTRPTRSLTRAFIRPARSTGGRRATRSLTRPTLSTHARRRLLALTAILALAAGGWVWLRDSSLVAVSDVKVTGLSGGPESAAIRNALTRAARDMTTLHVRPDRLRTAISPYPVVKDVKVETDFPHGMRIEVIEHDAVAAVELDGRRVPVASDGTLLRGRPADAELVSLDVPAANGGGRLTSRRGRAAVAAMGAAPKALRPYVSGVAFGPDGLRVSLRNGPILQLGDGARARAKWVAAARVLGDPRAAGASYVDLRVPERPVAGRFDDPTPATTDSQPVIENP